MMMLMLVLVLVLVLGWRTKKNNHQVTGDVGSK